MLPKMGLISRSIKERLKLKVRVREIILNLKIGLMAIRYPASLDTDLGMFVAIKDNPMGTEWGKGYTVAVIWLTGGDKTIIRRWGMVVVYENPSWEKTDITSFDGYCFL